MKRPRSSFGLTTLAVIVTVVSIGFVAVSSARRPPQSQPGEGVPDLLKNLGVALALVYFAVGVYLVIVALFNGQRRRPQRSTSKTLSGTLVLVSVVLLVSFWVTKFSPVSFPTLPESFRSRPKADQADTVSQVGIEKSVTWGLQLGFALVALMLVIAGIVNLRKRRSRVPQALKVDKRALVAVSLDELLLDLDRELDPRRAVLLADHGMEVALAEHGFPRAMSETAQEHVQRVASELSLSNTAARTLTMLYGHAHFSVSEMTNADRESAIEALQSVRDELRTKIPSNGGLR